MKLEYSISYVVAIALFMVGCEDDRQNQVERIQRRHFLSLLNGFSAFLDEAKIPPTEATQADFDEFLKVCRGETSRSDEVALYLAKNRLYDKLRSSFGNCELSYIPEGENASIMVRSKGGSETICIYFIKYEPLTILSERRFVQESLETFGSK